MLKSERSDMTRGSVGGHLISLTIPMLLGMSSMIIAWMIETIYIGILGAAELAAVSFTFPLVMGLSGISMGVGTGASSVIARKLGEGDRRSVQTLATHSLLLAVVLILALALLAYSCLEELFVLLGAQPEILPLILEYMRIWLLGLLLFGVPMVASSVLRAVGNAKIPGYAMAGSSLLGIVISPIMIFGLLGFPALGLVGSAWAGIVSGLVRLTVMLYVLIGQEDLLLIRSPRWKEMPQSFRSVLYIAFPAMLSSLISPVSLGVIIWLLAGHGPQVVAGFGVASRIDTLASMVLMSLSASVAPFIGQNWGARNVARVYAGLSFSYRVSLLWGLFCIVLLAPFGDDIINAINANPVVVASGAMYLLIVPISYGAMGVGMMSGSCFVALGRPIPNLVMSLARMALVYIPLAMLGNALFGYPGIYIATGSANVIMGIVAWRWNRSVLARDAARLRGAVV